VIPVTRTPPDHHALMAGLRTLVEHLSDRQGGLPVLTQLLTAAKDALGAAGATLVEHDDTGGRVVAATGAAVWAVGRPVAARPAPAGPTWEAVIDPADDALSAQLHGRGLRRVLGARVRRSGTRDGLLCVYFTTAEEVATPAHHEVLEFVSAYARELYRHGDRLPVTPTPPHAEDRDLLLAVASHELRTPVTVIKGYADTLDRHWDTWDPDARREAVRVIRQRGDELARLVDRLLTSTVDAPAVRCEPFDLVAVLRAATDELPGELRDRLLTRLPAALPPAYGDRSTVAPVVTELVTNAVKYSSDGVELLAGDDGRTVWFQVNDRGVGIAPEDVERAFTRFWQAGPDDHGRRSGAGIGLHLVRRIVERQRGWVSLRPRRSGGTVAEVRLLRSDVAETDK
jgi:signal transduction histidine kinase